MNEILLKQAEELPEEMKEKAVEIYNTQQKIYSISNILLTEVEPADEVDLLYFLHSAVKMMPQPHRERLFYETRSLLKIRREELEGRVKILKENYG